MRPDDVLQGLSQAGWKAEFRDVQRVFSDPFEADAFDAGLVFPSSDPAILGLLVESLLGLRLLPWIAVVTAEQMRQPALREFVGAYCVDYQTAPVDGGRLLHALGHAVGMSRLAPRPQGALPEAIGAASLLGHTPVVRRLQREIEKVAQSDVPVLITGESGTGKELVARAIHAQSERRDRPFVAINCVSLPPSLIHAELFGFERGAFSGARQRKAGQFESADGGTIFLDEIGDLQPDLQGLLLRFLQEHTVRRVGGRQEVKIDVRVIASTHVDLEQAIRRRTFREDLYYRLNVLRVRTPALREHLDDIEEIANAYLDTSAPRAAARRTVLSPPAVTAMRGHDWPGNVRELVNRVRSASVMCEGGVITPEDLGFESSPADASLQLDDARERAERSRILAALERSGWSARRSAQLVGVSRPTFYRLLKRHGLSSPAAAAAAVASAPRPATPPPRATEGIVPGDTTRFD